MGIEHQGLAVSFRKRSRLIMVLRDLATVCPGAYIPL